MNYANSQLAQTQMGSTNQMEPRDPEITRKLLMLQTALSRAEAHTSDLIGRIGPITSPEPPVATAPASITAIPATELGSMIGDLIARAESIGDRLDSAYRRVEI